MSRLQEIIEEGNGRIDGAIDKVIVRHCGQKPKRVKIEGIELTNHLLEQILRKLESA